MLGWVAVDLGCLGDHIGDRFAVPAPPELLAHRVLDAVRLRTRLLVVAFKRPRDLIGKLFD
jgi:hypothetical protein